MSRASYEYRMLINLRCVELGIMWCKNDSKPADLAVFNFEVF